MRNHLLILVAILFSFTKTSGQKKADNFPPPENRVEIKAIKTEGKITIDGKLNEPDWKRASPITDFFKTEPIQGGPVKNSTEVRILFDSKNLYIGVFAKDSLGKKGVRIQDLRRDFNIFENDIIGVQIDPQNTKQYALSFQTTPYGNQTDYQSFNDRFRDFNWNALWTVRTQRTDQGYFVEYAIPFKSIRYDTPENSEPVNWGITIYRLARRDYEKTVFPPIPQSFSQDRMIYAAQLMGLELPLPATNIRVEPYTLYQFNESKVGASTSEKLSEPKVGGDLKWAVDPKTVVDLTINTDFAQADVDRAVNNLGRFNIFFQRDGSFFSRILVFGQGVIIRKLSHFLAEQLG